MHYYCQIAVTLNYEYFGVRLLAYCAYMNVAENIVAVSPQALLLCVFLQEK